MRWAEYSTREVVTGQVEGLNVQGCDEVVLFVTRCRSEMQKGIVMGQG